MDTDYDQPLILIFLSPRADIRKLAAPIDARIGPELDQHDFPLQRRVSQWRRIEPGSRAVERRQFGARVRGSDRGELRSRNCHGRSTEETAPGKPDFFEH